MVVVAGRGRKAEAAARLARDLVPVRKYDVAMYSFLSRGGGDALQPVSLMPGRESTAFVLLLAVAASQREKWMCHWMWM